MFDPYIIVTGLRYVTETQSYNSYDPPKFKCGLCVVEVSKPFIITHLTGHQHRIAYIVSQINTCNNRPRWLSWMRVRQETRRSQVPRQGQQHSFVEIDHEIFSTVILSFLLIQEGRLSVSGERMCTILVNHLKD